MGDVFTIDGDEIMMGAVGFSASVVESRTGTKSSYR
jgi:hypothetical protein